MRLLPNDAEIADRLNDAMKGYILPALAVAVAVAYVCDYWPWVVDAARRGWGALRGWGAGRGFGRGSRRGSR